MTGPSSAPLHSGDLPVPLAIYLATVAHRTIERAVDGWRRGIPKYEIALLNRVTEPFNGLSLTLPCPHGIPWPYLHLSSRLYQLHGRGGRVPGQRRGSDAYGADLAVTVEVSTLLTKTAFLQFKRTDRDSVEVEDEQLEQAKRFADVWERSFVLVADEREIAWPLLTSMLVSSSADVQALLPLNSPRKRISLCHPNWHPLSVWLVAWLLCEMGPPTLSGNPDPIEDRLRGYAEAISTAEGDEDFAREQYPEFSRLQGWLHLDLSPREA